MEQNLKTKKLAKLLALTTSANDNEALSAIRKANFLLNEANIEWIDLLGAETPRGFVELKYKYNQLNYNFHLLVSKYNLLISQLMAAQISPQYKSWPQRRKFSRF